MVAVTGNLVSLFFFAGLVWSFGLALKKKICPLIVWGSGLVGLLGGIILFCIRLFDPKGANIALIRCNRWLVVLIAVVSLGALVWGGIARSFFAKKGVWERPFYVALLSLSVGLSLVYLSPQIFQYTREFVYFGESGISTMALLRGIGFTLGLLVCFLVFLSSFWVYRAFQGRAALIFLNLATCVYALDYGVRAVAALQRLKIIGLSDMVFEIMIFGDTYSNVFIFGALMVGVFMIAGVVPTHLHVQGEFPNKALRRKEKARLRFFRRWSYSLFSWSALAVFIVVVLNYFDTKPPEMAPPEEYSLRDGIITIPLDQVSDGHLHRFSYMTPSDYDVRFLVVKKPAGAAYGVGLDACEICGVAGYFERGDQVVCRRCDVVMNKNTIGFKGGCNPIPFPYEVKDSKIIINVKELERHERRFR